MTDNQPRRQTLPSVYHSTGNCSGSSEGYWHRTDAYIGSVTGAATRFTLGCSRRNLLVWDKGSGCGNFYTNEHELIIFSTLNTRFQAKGARNIIRGIPAFNSGAKKTNGEKVHPTQKPVELIEKLILDSTKPGDTVLDCFMGSGTTAVAALKNGRNFYGFELQQKYVDIANKRIKEL